MASVKPIALLAVAGLLAGCDPPATTNAAGKPDGAKLYALYCAGCHGADGRKGDAAAHLDRLNRLTNAGVRRVIENGRGAMPAWRSRLNAQEISAVSSYIRRFSTSSPAR